MGELDLRTVELLCDHLGMKESTDLTLFSVSTWSLDQRNESNPMEGIKMTMVLKRKIMNEMMTTYLPSILLITITYATTFFQPVFFEAALSVNLTTMLVLTTIFIGVNQELPSTAYIKMIDIWLVFCQLIPFTEVVLLTIREQGRVKEDGREEDPTIPTAKHNLGLCEADCLATITNNDNNMTENWMEQPMEAWVTRDNSYKWLRFIGEQVMHF